MLVDQNAQFEKYHVFRTSETVFWSDMDFKVVQSHF